MRGRFFKFCLIVAGIVIMPSLVFAQDALFETTLPWYYGWSAMQWGQDSFTYTSGVSIRYTPSSNQEVCAIKPGLYKSGNPTDNVILTVREGGNGYPTGGQAMGAVIVPGNQVANAPLISSDSAYTTFSFSPCLNLITGTNYSFVLSRTQPDTNNLYVFQTSNLIYYPQTAVWGYVPINGVWQEKIGFEPALRLEGPSIMKAPVIIVPGMLGTELSNGADFIWPDLDQMLFDINDEFLIENLALDSDGASLQNIETGDVAEIFLNNIPIFEVNIFQDLKIVLEQNFYIENTDLFFFPYDWRLDLEDTKELLKQKIDQVKLATGFDKVNIIAHSMGGLLVKDYVSQYGENDIDKLIFVGTPHLGAPKAGKVLLEGDNFGIPWLEKSTLRSLSLNSPSAYELLPTEKYFEQFIGYLKQFNSVDPLDYFQTKNFILSKGANANIFDKAEIFFDKDLQDVDLSNISVYNIAGCRTGTQAGYQYAEGNNEIQDIKYISGDKTVPLVSADYINTSNKYYVKDGQHSELPSANGVRELILSILENQNSPLANNVSTDQSFCNFQGKELLWRSPVEVHIYDSAGKHTGPIENNAIEYGIPGVDYEIIGHEKFIFLPTGEGQIYQVIAWGLDQGTFDLVISENNNGTITGATVFNDVPVTTSTSADINISSDSVDNAIQVDDGDGNFQTVFAIAQLSGEESDDVMPPETNVVISGVAGDNGWYRSNVAISLNAIDNSSGVLETRYSLDGGSTFSVYIAPLNINVEGVSQIQYFSIDRAGNNEAIKTTEIKIDETAPEISVQFDLTAKDFIFTAHCEASQCVARDEAGNTVVLKIQRIERARPQIKFISISYNGEPARVFPDNKFIVSYQDSKGILKDFNQSIVIKNVERARIDYQKKKDQSVIITRTKGDKVIKEIVGGMRFLQLSTQKGILNIDIE